MLVMFTCFSLKDHACATKLAESAVQQLKNEHASSSLCERLAHSHDTWSQVKTVTSGIDQLE